MKRIGMVGVNTFNPNLCDGVSASMFELLRFLKQQGSHVFILNYLTAEPYKTHVLHCLAETPGSEILSRGSHHCKAVLHGVEIHQEQLSRPEREALIGQPDVLKKIIRGIQDAHADYVFTIDRNQTALLAVSVTGTPGAHFFRSPAYIPEYIRQPMFIKILENTMVFAVSDFTRNYLSELLGIQAVTWCPIFDFDRHLAAHRPEKTKTVGYYSAGKHKGDEVMAHVIREMRHVPFVVMGRNYGPGASPPPNVEYLGDVPDNRIFYERTGLLTLPSMVEEGFPRVILEAAVNGIPAIANNVGGTSEAMDSAGILTDAKKDDPPEKVAEKYISAIRSVLSDDGAYAAWCQKALQRAKDYEHEQYRMSLSVYDRHIQPYL
ncbi:MAG: hypothetical protein B6245_01745 [Desulfobacteraceae bacterium 4572_88]|nr:MAG: hypothetical protein B6245_01745 [Desulfobacteraceae bacterium 4572_88]